MGKRLAINNTTALTNPDLDDPFRDIVQRHHQFPEHAESSISREKLVMGMVHYRKSKPAGSFTMR